MQKQNLDDKRGEKGRPESAFGNRNIDTCVMECRMRREFALAMGSILQLLLGRPPIYGINILGAGVAEQDRLIIRS